jgi:hypothetical protein
MIEARAMARELQEQLTGAVKASQEQFRKGQETAASAVRTWTNTAKTVRTRLPKQTLPAAQLPKLPALSLPTLADVKEAGAKLREMTLKDVRLKDVKLPDVRLPKLPAQPLNRITSTDEFAESAERLANRVLVTQLKFAGRTLHSAAPVIAEGAAFLTRAADRVASRVQTAPQASPAESVAEVVELAPATEAGTAKASPAKPKVTKASTAKAPPAKAAATKPAAAKASGTARKAKTTK